MPDNTKQKETTSAFPLRWPVSFRTNRNLRLVEISEEGATEVFDTLTSETARELLSRLHNEPQTASDLAETADTSIQNVQYHMQKFEDVGLVEVVDQWYSSRGAEMNVYGSTDRALVLYAGKEPDKHSLREGLSQILGIIALLGIISLVFDYLIRSLAETPSAAPVTDPSGTPSPTNPVGFQFLEVIIPPGAVFFIGGLSVLALSVIWRYARH